MCPGIVPEGCSCLLFPVSATAAPCALSACFPYQLAVQGGRGRLCRTGVQPYKYRAGVCCHVPLLHLREESVSTVVKCVLLLWLSFPFSWISPRNSACLFWGKRNFAVWMLAQVVMVSHLGSMSLVIRSGLCMANMTVKTDRFQNFKFWI